MLRLRARIRTVKVHGVTLFDGPEDEDPYKYLPYEECDGRGLGVGVIEDLFEAQVWTNYNVKQKKDMLDLAGKWMRTQAWAYAMTAYSFTTRVTSTDSRTERASGGTER
jgi:hypothetical protein